MALPGKGKKRVTTFKQSSLSKQHKSNGAGAVSNTKKATHNNSASLTDVKSLKSTSTGSFPLDKPTKVKNKGKAPELIATVEQDSSSEAEDEEEGGMEVEEDLAADFLMDLDVKGMAVSRPALVASYRKEKPAAVRRASTIKVALPEPALLKSEIRALKTEANRKKRKGAVEEVEEAEPVFSDEETAAPKKKHKAGELIDDLEEDDLAFGSGSSDDGLSVMSDLDEDDMSEMSEMSDISGSEDLSEDDEELEWSDEGSAVEVVDAPSAFPDEEEEEEEDSELDEDEDSQFDSASDSDSAPALRQKKRMAPPSDDDDLETAYERRPAGPKAAKPRPTKLPIISNGNVLRAASPLDRSPSPSPSPSPEPEEPSMRKESEYRSDPLGQRFGRPAVRNLLEIKNKKERIAKAREEIADLGREAAGTGEGEGGLNLLKRLLSLTAPKFSSSSAAKSAGEKPILIDREIRIMAMISLLAVLVDIIPGYRIRPLTDAEKEVKVSQMVARQREWEDGLVGVYKRFLEMCETEVTEETPLAAAALHSLSHLVQEKPDFNFAVNIMDVLVKRVGRKGWDEGHQICLATIVHLFANDTSTVATNSLHLVRLISRLVKARSFAIRPEVLSTLLNLRLKDELGGGRIRASADAVFREKEGRKGIVRWNQEKDRKGKKGGKAKEAMSKSGSKKARAVRKERVGIEREMAEAEGEVRTEEREKNMTETLKLLFALYFRIVKLEYRSPLLPAALEGLARFSHLVNIDFFRDLLEVLKGLIARANDDEEEALEEGFSRRNDQREKLLCIVTAFELLQGQGEALNIDLGEFITALYAVILPLALSPTFEEAPYIARNALTNANKASAKSGQTEADLLFRALAAIFLVKHLPAATRTLAFSKRLLTCSLQWPAASQLRTLSFLRALLIREPQLEAMLETGDGDRKVDGRYRGDYDEPERAMPESTCFYEAGLFLKSHPDQKVRNETRKMVNWVRD